jgi:hypothetical protein
MNDALPVTCSSQDPHLTGEHDVQGGSGIAGMPEKLSRSEAASARCFQGSVRCRVQSVEQGKVARFHPM